MFQEIEEIVERPLIEEVFILGSDESIQASLYLESDRREFAKIRLNFETAIIKGEPIACCAACHRPVKPRLSVKRRRFFRHHNGDGDCPYQTSGEASQRLIDAMRYNGRKEGPEHIRLKELLVASLEYDITFKDVMVESRWWGAVNPEMWKKPDVAADHFGLPIAFEIQLSTTFLNVMADRRKFYLENGGLLIWIVKNIFKDDRRQFQDDIFYNNNSNLFIIDDETTKISREKLELTLRCHYLEPVVCDSQLKEEWREELVSFSQLTIERENQRIYFFDFAEAKKKANKRLQDASDEDLRSRFIEYWAALGLNATGTEGMNGHWPNEWNRIVIDLGKRGITLPYDRPDYDLARFSCLAFSTYKGKCIGFKYERDNFLQVANYAFDNCKDLLWYFGDLLDRTGHWNIIAEQDKAAGARKQKTGKTHHDWAEKWPVVKVIFRDNDPTYLQKRQYDTLYSFLFPVVDEL